MKNKGGVDVKNQETWKKRPDTPPTFVFSHKLARLPSWWQNVFVFSHTFGQFTLMVA